MKAIGLIGCGQWGKHILRDLRTLGCDVAVVARSAESRGRAEQGGAGVIVDRVDALPDVKGVIVSTPTSVHVETVRSVLDRGVPIFVEKPLCCSVRDAHALAEATPDRLFVMDKWRYHPGVELMRDIVRRRELGPIVGLQTTRVQWGSPHDDTDSVWHLAPHDLAIALEILGALPPACSARADFIGPDCRTLIGILGGDPWVSVEVSSRYTRARREVRLCCRDGVAVLDDAYSPHLSILRSFSKEEPAEEKRAISPEMPLLKELRAFVEFLDGGSPPRSNVADAVAVVSAIEGLRDLAGVPRR